MQLTDTLSHNIIYHKRDTDEPITKAVSKYTGCANKKTIPYEKFIISVTVTDFFTKFTAFTGGFVPHAQQISPQNLLWFNNYNHLNLKVQFSKRTSN